MNNRDSLVALGNYLAEFSSGDLEMFQNNAAVIAEQILQARIAGFTLILRKASS